MQPDLRATQTAADHAPEPVVLGHDYKRREDGYGWRCSCGSGGANTVDRVTHLAAVMLRQEQVLAHLLDLAEYCDSFKPWKKVPADRLAVMEQFVVETLRLVRREGAQ